MKLRKFENEFLVYTQNHTKTDKFLYPKFPHRRRLVDGVYFHKKMDWAKRVGEFLWIFIGCLLKLMWVWVSKNF